mgnify:CR=1 FL=1
MTTDVLHSPHRAFSDPRRGRRRLQRRDPHAADSRRAPDAATPTPPELYLKLEALQPIGSFKIRGAYNVVRQLTPAQLSDGVWTVSAGNAAQGVAFAARKAGARCSVMVMDTAPDTKIRAIERLGASDRPRDATTSAGRPSNRTGPTG